MCSDTHALKLLVLLEKKLLENLPLNEIGEENRGEELKFWLYLLTALNPFPYAKYVVPYTSSKSIGSKTWIKGQLFISTKGSTVSSRDPVDTGEVPKLENLGVFLRRLR